MRYLKSIEDEELIGAVKEDVLPFKDYEHSALEAVNNFSFNDFEFIDFFEVDNQKWTYRFIWACWAIVWGIREYDLYKEGAAKVKGLN